MNQKGHKLLILSLSLLGGLLIRLVPLRAPNIEPILTTCIPLSKKMGAGYGFLFGALSVFIYDITTGTLGVWTIFTTLSYGITGLCIGIFFKTRSLSNKNILISAVIGTILYDALTGLVVGPVVFNQSFAQAFIGQIPFTALHLLGNISLSLLLAPAIFKIFENLSKSRRRILSPLLQKPNLNKI